MHYTDYQFIKFNTRKNAIKRCAAMYPPPLMYSQHFSILLLTLLGLLMSILHPSHDVEDASRDPSRHQTEDSCDPQAMHPPPTCPVQHLVTLVQVILQPTLHCSQESSEHWLHKQQEWGRGEKAWGGTFWSLQSVLGLGLPQERVSGITYISYPSI